MKIAQIAPLYESVPPRFYGGTERVVSWLTEELVRLGHDVTLFASGDSVTNARLVPVCKEALRLSPTCIDQAAHHVLMIEQVFNEKDSFDLLHFHLDYLHFSLSRRAGVPHISTLHGRLDIPDLVPLYREFREVPLISISDAQRAPLPWVNWQGTVYHGLPETEYSLGSGNGKYLAFLGRISPEKGLNRAIEIAKRAEIPLKIAAKIDRADTEYFQTVIKPLLKHPLVEFLGEIGGEEKNEFLGNAMGLLFPICWPEPFGLVMIEAMACGTPVIAYPYGSVPEIMEDGMTGFVVADVSSASKAAHQLHRIDRKVCRQRFEKRFSASRMAQDYLLIYKKLLCGEPEPVEIGRGDFNWIKLASPNRTT